MKGDKNETSKSVDVRERSPGCGVHGRDGQDSQGTSPESAGEVQQDGRGDSCVGIERRRPYEADVSDPDGRKITDACVNEIIEDLMGTCKSLSDSVRNCTCHAYDEGSLTQKQLEMIDMVIFCCEGCGWWCDADELGESDGDEQYCDDCAGDLGADDD